MATSIASAFVLLLTRRCHPFRLADVVVAFAPGAQDTMMVLALAMHLDPVYVGALHLSRFLVVTPWCRGGAPAAARSARPGARAPACAAAGHRRLNRPAAGYPDCANIAMLHVMLKLLEQAIRVGA